MQTAAKRKPVEPARSRAAAGHTQRAAATLLGVSYRTWQDWEAGIAQIPAPMLRLYRHLAGLERIAFRAAEYRRPE